ncbi:MAG: hypothetical protein CMP19_05795 [Rickettsiales bacterium]|nr:hypothetical protein [Rickettsiales bacterium]|tara:strand:- start:6291 stop:7700 length:1410 start_codon:yes stop_codon:yes gene_type:complete
MLGFHPPLEADEIPYSWLVTYCQLSGLPSNKALLEQLHIAHYQLASQFPGYVPLISEESRLSARKVIHEHTILPAFKPFIHPTTYSSALVNLAKGSASNLHTRMSLVANRVNSGSVLRACPTCIECDCNEVGRAWWHVQHQLPGCSVCLTHSEPLSEVNVRRRALILPSEITSQRGGVLENVDVQLSGLVHDVWRRGKSLFSYQHITTRYRHRLVEAGFASHIDAIRQDKLRYALRAYWATSASPAVQQLLLDSSYPESLFRAKRAQFHPLKHLLLIGLLWHSWNDFCEYTPCECVTPDRAGANVLSEGDADADIIRLLQQGESLRAVSERCRRSVIYVKKLAIQNNIPVKTRAKRIFGVDRALIVGMLKNGVKTQQIASEFDYSVGAVEQVLSQQPGLVEKRHQMRFNAQCHKHQNCILQALAEHPEYYRGDFQREFRTSYSWLFKHNKEWLYSVMPDAIPRSRRRVI